MYEVFLLVIISLSPIKARRCIIPPLIDGTLEQIWHSGDSVVEFTQWMPHQDSSPTQSTSVYLCYDTYNLYIFFRCFDSEPDKIIVRTTPRDNIEGDYVGLILDTFGDKTTAYSFFVSAAGVQGDTRISQDGRVSDISWDGVWYSAVRRTEYGYNVEIMIPFKTLRYNSNLYEWGINFFRRIARKQEYDSWIPQKQAEGIRISRCGILKGIHPEEKGLHLEIYPVGLLRYEMDSLQPQLGLDLSWRTSSAHLSLTTYPDFAQIEADPYTINLSKYELFFKERRPFFIEGKEIFDTSIKLFYSRRIGKRLPNGKDIPIIGGIKYIGSYKRMNFGFLSAYTEEVLEEEILEPKTFYPIGRISLQILKNSNIGILYSGALDRDDSQQAMGMDGTFRTRELQFIGQLARTEKNAYAKLLSLNFSGRKFQLTTKYEKYDEQFDIHRMGYAPWRGKEQYYLNLGPRFFDIGNFYTLAVGIGGGRVREVFEPGWGYWINEWISSSFKNNWEFSLYLYQGKNYEIDRWYYYKQITIRLQTDYTKSLNMHTYLWYKDYEFNYRRGYFAPMGLNNFSFQWKVNPSLSISIGLENSLEWEPDGKMGKTSWVARPTLQYALTKDIQLRMYAEPNTDIHIHKFNFLFSWNFRPKSWIYLAFNETRDNSKGKMELLDRIIVLKIRFLLFL